MAQMIKKSFDSPDETRPIAKGKVDVVNFSDLQPMRITFDPGWRWSESVKPIVKTDSCQVHHLTYVISGRMAVRMDDGSETEFGPGDVGVIPPGHDAWVVGNEPVVGIDFRGGAIYAKPPS
jgi:mannose-6-phosphate isomerase-like protein (cupin superfamily)